MERPWVTFLSLMSPSFVELCKQSTNAILTYIISQYRLLMKSKNMTRTETGKEQNKTEMYGSESERRLHKKIEIHKKN